MILVAHDSRNTRSGCQMDSLQSQRLRESLVNAIKLIQKNGQVKPEQDLGAAGGRN